MVACEPYLLPPEVVRFDLPLLAPRASEGDGVGPLDSPGGSIAASSGAVPSGCHQGSRRTRVLRERPIISKPTNKYMTPKPYAGTIHRTTERRFLIVDL